MAGYQESEHRLATKQFGVPPLDGRWILNDINKALGRHDLGQVSSPDWSRPGLPETLDNNTIGISNIRVAVRLPGCQTGPNPGKGDDLELQVTLTNNFTSAQEAAVTFRVIPDTTLDQTDVAFGGPTPLSEYGSIVRSPNVIEPGGSVDVFGSVSLTSEAVNMAEGTPPTINLQIDVNVAGGTESFTATQPFTITTTCENPLTGPDTSTPMYLNAAASGQTALLEIAVVVPSPIDGVPLYVPPEGVQGFQVFLIGEDAASYPPFTGDPNADLAAYSDAPNLPVTFHENTTVTCTGVCQVTTPLGQVYMYRGGQISTYQEDLPPGNYLAVAVYSDPGTGGLLIEGRLPQALVPAGNSQASAYFNIPEGPTAVTLQRFEARPAANQALLVPEIAESAAIALGLGLVINLLTRRARRKAHRKG